MDRGVGHAHHRALHVNVQGGLLNLVLTRDETSFENTESKNGQEATSFVKVFGHILWKGTLSGKENAETLRFAQWINPVHEGSEYMSKTLPKCNVD